MTAQQRPGMVRYWIFALALLGNGIMSINVIGCCAFVPVPRHRRHAPVAQSIQRRPVLDRQETLLSHDANGGGSSSSSSSAATTTSSSSPVRMFSSHLSPVEVWCVTHIDLWYSRSLSIRCPFLKRRSADMLDGLDAVMRFLVIRHKSLDLIGPPPGCRSMTTSPGKHRHSTIDERLAILRQDWKPNSNKGYYITGRLNSTIYKDDCFFDGPDPDMPVRGLRKYTNAASHLFDHATSTAELLSLEVLPSEVGRSTTTTNPVIEARWRLQGVLHLPWHPKLPVWTGRTRYHFDDDDGLIYHHEEEWDISVLQAFMETLCPDLASRIWNDAQLRNGAG